MRIIIYGSGKLAETVFKNLKREIEVVKIIVTSPKKNEKFMGNQVEDAQILFKYQKYDYIIIASMFKEEIFKYILGMGVKEEKIIQLDGKQKENFFYHKNERCITLITDGSTSCNSKVLYEYLKKEKNKFKVELIDIKDLDRTRIYDIVLSNTLEGNGVYSYIYIEMWHGFPIKKIGKLAGKKYNLNEKIDYFLSYNNLYSMIMSSLFSVDLEKFIITGMPRNEELFSEKSKVYDKYKLKEYKKLIIYAPTFRKSDVVYDENYVEGIEMYLEKEEIYNLNEFLEKNNYIFIIKPHKYEINKYKNYCRSNILVLEDCEFKEENFYKLVGKSDLLITDYSSIAIDYLLTQKPMIFYQYDFIQYDRDRGFIFDNLEEVFIGEKAHDLDELKEKIYKILNCEKDEYMKLRKRKKSLFHKNDSEEFCKEIYGKIIKKEIKRV